MKIIAREVNPIEIELKRTNTFYDKELRLIIHEFEIDDNFPFSVGETMEVEYISDNDEDSYNEIILQRNNNKIYTVEFYSDYYYQIVESHLNMKSVKKIDARKTLGINFDEDKFKKYY